MNTQHGTDVQDHEPHLSGELHLPKSGNTGSQRTQATAQPKESASPAQANDSQKQDGDNLQNVFYYDDDENASLEEDDPDVLGSALATTHFQMSEAMPPVYASRSGQFAHQGATPPQPPATRSPRRFPVVRVLILVAVIVLALLTGAMALAQSSSAALPLHGTVPLGTTHIQKGTPNAKPIQPTQTKGMTPTIKPTVPPVTGSGITPKGQNGGAGSWLPQQLPGGWANAGLTTGDALFTERTAIAFTDREMSLDYRSVGTRVQHGGTLTAATFILTANAKTRFAQNDVRVINNVLFDKVQQEKLIASVVNAQPQLVQFSTNGQQQMAWVDVSFQLWQSKIDATGTRTEGFDADPTTTQPRTHHMMVLLLRVPQMTQGNTPAMGGTGWLVTNYAFDLRAGTPLDIVQPA